jgi:hypothetical protein
MAFVRKKRVGRYEYHQLVENHWVDGKPRQKVLLHLGRYPTVEAALEGWPKEIEGLRRFARTQRQRAERLSRDCSSKKKTVESTSQRARKAETLADEIAAKLEKLQEIEEQGKI